MADEQSPPSGGKPEQIPLNWHIEYFELTFGYADFLIHLGESISTSDGQDFNVSPKFIARATMAPATAKELSRALTDAVAKFESRFGVIWIPPEKDNDVSST